jgi:hypothetical protein
MRLPILLAPGADKENAPVIATVRVNAHGVRGLIAVLANPAQTVLILLHCAQALHVLKTLHRSLVHAVAGCTAITEVNPVHRIRGTPSASLEETRAGSSVRRGERRER